MKYNVYSTKKQIRKKSFSLQLEASWTCFGKFNLKLVKISKYKYKVIINLLAVEANKYKKVALVPSFLCLVSALVSCVCLCCSQYKRLVASAQ